MLGFHNYFSCRLNLIFSLRYFIFPNKNLFPYSQDLYQHQHQHQEEYGVSKNNVYQLRYTDVHLPYLFFICFISPLLASHSFSICILIIFSFYFGPCNVSYCIIIDSTLLFYTPSSLLCPFLLLFLALPFSCPFLFAFAFTLALPLPLTPIQFISTLLLLIIPPLLSSSLLTTLLTTLS